MHIVLVWIYAFTFIFMITTAWYVAQPLTYSMVAGASSVSSSLGGGTKGTQTLSILQYLGLLWGPILDCFVLLWAVLNSQRRDVVSKLYE